jgi:hypothetical protein
MYDVITISKLWGITVMGNLTLSGSGTLSLINSEEDSLSCFVNAFGNIKIDGPSIIADMKKLKNYKQVMMANGFSFTDNTQMGKIIFDKGSLIIKNVGSDQPGIYGTEGLSLSSGSTIKAGISEDVADTVTVDHFWNFEEWGAKVGPSPKDYKYIVISSEQINNPHKAVVNSINSPAVRKIIVKLKELQNVDGYQIVYSTSSSFKNNTTKRVATKSLTTTISSLVSGKIYYLKVRAYRVNSNGTFLYGSFSSLKKVKVK